MPSLVSHPLEAPIGTTLAMFYLGVFPMAVAYVTYAYAFSRMRASAAASFLYLVPVLAYLIAWLWIAEMPTFLSALGGALALSGVLLVNRCVR